MPRFATKRLGVKVKVENLTVNELWSSFFSNSSVFLRSKTYLLFIKTKRRRLHRYLRIVTSFQRVAHLARKCVNATAFRRFVGKQKDMTEGSSLLEGQ